VAFVGVEDLAAVSAAIKLLGQAPGRIRGLWSSQGDGRIRVQGLLAPKPPGQRRKAPNLQANPVLANGS